MAYGIDIAAVLPELWLGVGALVLLMVGAFGRSHADRAVFWLSCLLLTVALVIVLGGTVERQVVMGGLFVSDGFSQFMKVLVLLGALLSLVMAQGYRTREHMAQFEFPALVVLATLGMLMMISANDLMSLYIGLELQSLSLYVLAAFKRDSLRSTEAGLKYFILGALSSGMLLYGCSLVYGLTGTTNFDAIAASLVHESSDGRLIGLLAGLVFIAAALAFKVSAVPFHMWTPDVYEGSPTPVTAFFAAAPKIAAMALFVRVFVSPFGGMTGEWQQVVVFVSIASMSLGAVAAIAQRNIKRLMAYSSIGHVGYALVGLAAGTELGVRGIAVYMAIYLMMTIGTFGCILAMRRRGQMVENIDDLAGLSRTQPMLAFAMGVMMFSLTGIPPLAGFFGKLYVFMAAVEAGLYGLAVIGILTSVVAAFYYLRIVKLMYFDEPAEPFDRPMGNELGIVVGATSLVTLLFFLYQTPVLVGAQVAASALFP